MPQLDSTHDPALRSWVPSANGHLDFPIQNLPFCVFSPPDGEPRGGVAIGDDYANYSAHLFLSESYDALQDPRKEDLRYQTPWEDYFTVLQWDQRGTIADSAHMVMQEQPGRFLVHLVTDALPFAQKDGDAAPAEVIE